MKSRCLNPNDDSFKHYGGRGITVCARWAHSFVNFYKDMGARQRGLTLERMDNNGNYEPSNCKWATRLEQVRNTRRCRILTINGVTGTLSLQSEIYGISESLLRYRLKRGLTGKELTKFPRKQT